MFLLRRSAAVLLLFVGLGEIGGARSTGFAHRFRSHFTTGPEEMNLAKSIQNSKDRIADSGENQLNFGRTKAATISKKSFRGERRIESNKNRDRGRFEYKQRHAKISASENEKENEQRQTPIRILTSAVSGLNPAADVALAFPAKDLDIAATTGGDTAPFAMLGLHPAIRLLLDFKPCRSRRRKRSDPDSGGDDEDDDETSKQQQREQKEKTSTADGCHRHPRATAEVYSALTACLRAAVEAGRDGMTFDQELRCGGGGGGGGAGGGGGQRCF